MKPSSLERAGAMAVLALLALLGGCATPSQPEAMEASPSQEQLHRSSASVSIEVSGGRPTSAVRTPQVSDADFALALHRSIERWGVFQRVAESGGDYRLVAYIGRLDHPLMGRTIRVEMEVEYQLYAFGEAKPLWRGSVRSDHVLGTGQAPAFVERVRLGNEAAARKNIERFLTEVAALQLP